MGPIEKGAPLREDFGLVVDAAGLGGAEDLDAAWVRAALRRHGVLVLRATGAPGDLEEAARWLARVFGALVDRFYQVPGRISAVPGAEVQILTDARSRPLQFHAEHAWHPLRPDLGAFLCVAAAGDGSGQTALVQGAHLHAALSPDAQRIFAANRVRYVCHAGSRWWRSRHPGSTLEQVIEQLSTLPGVEVRRVDTSLLARYFECDLLQDEVLRLDFVDRVVVADARGPVYRGSAHRHDYTAFAAGVRYRKSGGELGVSATFEDGGELTPELRLDVDRAAESACVEWAWRPRDLVLIDNWNVLHGRLRAGGEGRRLVSAWGHASWLAQPG